MAVIGVSAAPPASRAGTAISGALAAAVVAAQIAYPRIAAGTALDRLTVVTVVLFFGASVVHAAATRGVRFAAVLVAVTAGGGLLVEAIGVATGVPFGAYAYNDTLGWTVAGVPLVIGMAWTMMAYPAYVVGTVVAGSGRWLPLVAGAALATWDLFLDPQMVAAGHWRWAETGGPQLLDIPITNFIGWLVVATAMMALVRRIPSRTSSDDRVPLALYLWTYVSSVLAHAVYFDLPASALAGGIGMGAVVALLLRALLRPEPRR